MVIRSSRQQCPSVLHDFKEQRRVVRHIRDEARPRGLVELHPPHEHLCHGLLEESDKTQQLEEEGAFGYKGLHLDLKLLPNRQELPEYRRFRDLRFEVQLRTIVQDAWSALDHKIKYKKNIPHVLKRRINRLAAIFELADQEFLAHQG